MSSNDVVIRDALSADEYSVLCAFNSRMATKKEHISSYFYKDFDSLVAKGLIEAEYRITEKGGRIQRMYR